MELKSPLGNVGEAVQIVANVGSNIAKDLQPKSAIETLSNGVSATASNVLDKLAGFIGIPRF